MSHYQLFEDLGLSPNEAKIYEFLVERGESGVSEIAAGASIHRRNAYDAIHRLIDKGLCFQIFSNAENRYNAVDPEKLLELVAEKHKRLEDALPDLKKKFSQRIVQEEAYIYRGLEGQRSIWRDVLRVGEDSYFIGAKGGWFDSRLESSRVQFFKEAKRKNIKFIQLFDHEVRSQGADFPQKFDPELEYRFLPEKYSTNSAIHIFGDYVVTYTGLKLGALEDNLVFFVIHSKDLAGSYRTWFQYMWQQSSSERGADGMISK